MLLEDKNAVIYGGGGSIGGAVSRALAREGARGFLPGRTPPRLDDLARLRRVSDRIDREYAQPAAGRRRLMDVVDEYLKKEGAK